MNGDNVTVNGDNVTVRVFNPGDVGAVATMFRVESTAEDLVTGDKTTVVCHVVPKYVPPGNFFGSGITAIHDVKVWGTVEGDIQSSGTVVFASSGTGDTIIVEGGVTCKTLDATGTKVIINGPVVCETLIFGNNCVVNYPPVSFEERVAVECLSFDSSGTINGNVECVRFDNTGTVNGNVACVEVVREGDVEGIFLPPPSEPPVVPDLKEDWWMKTELDRMYGGQVPPGPPYYPSTTIGPGLKESINMGYSFSSGDVEFRSLTVPKASGSTEANPVILGGTVFVTGDFTLEQDEWLDLNGQTIYIWGSAMFRSKSNIMGSGAIIALGEITFEPNVAAPGAGAQSVVLHSEGNGTWASHASNTWLSLNGVWGRSSTEIWAVGDGGVIIPYDGSTWGGAVASGTADQLSDVCGISDRAFAVGNGGTIVEHLYSSGLTGSWTQVYSAGNNLNAVWCSESDNVAFAVGDGGTIVKYEYGSNSWTEVNHNSTLRNLLDVWGSSASDVWAAGELGTILHYDPVNGWRNVAPSPNPVPYTLRGVWGRSDTDVFFVGDHGTIRHYSSGAWSSMTIANTLTPPDLQDVWGTPSGKTYAVGLYGDLVSLAPGGVLWLAEPSGTFYDLHAVWGSSASDVYAVGKSGWDYVLVISLSDRIYASPGTENFHGSFVAWGDEGHQGLTAVKPGASLVAPSSMGVLNIPYDRVMRIEGYTITQH
jgi:cytoskeletal protein CcmA (bactofilin family)